MSSLQQSYHQRQMLVLKHFLLVWLNEQVLEYLLLYWSIKYESENWSIWLDFFPQSPLSGKKYIYVLPFTSSPQRAHVRATKFRPARLNKAWEWVGPEAAWGHWTPGRAATLRFHGYDSGHCWMQHGTACAITSQRHGRIKARRFSCGYGPRRSKLDLKEMRQGLRLTKGGGKMGFNLENKLGTDLLRNPIQLRRLPMLSASPACEISRGTLELVTSGTTVD